MHSLAPRSTLAGKRGTGIMKGLEQIGTRAYFRPTGVLTLAQGLALVAAAIRAARDLGVADMLVDTTGASGFASPNAFERYELGTSWADAAGPHLAVAFVIRPEMIDPQKLGAVVAQNRNAIVDVFGSEAEALAWLDARVRPVHQNRRQRNRLDGD